MTKIKFIMELHERLSGLPKDDVEERLSFYSEMIDDRIEDGLTEEEAVAHIGSIDEIVDQITADVPLTKIVKEKIKSKRRLNAWEIVLIILGAPIWASLLITVLSVTVSLYATIWAVIVSLWAVFSAFIATAFGTLISGGAHLFTEFTLSGVAMIGVALICSGLSILFFFGCKSVTKGTAMLTAKTVLRIKKFFIKKEAAQ